MTQETREAMQERLREYERMADRFCEKVHKFDRGELFGFFDREYLVKMTNHYTELADLLRDIINAGRELTSEEALALDLDI